MAFRFTAEEMGTLTEAEKDAIVDVVIAGVLANETPEEDELSRLDEELRAVDWGLSEEIMFAKVQAAFTKIHGYTTPEEAMELVRTAGATLVGESIREKTFALLARVMYSGGPMDAAQKAVLTAFSQAFAIPLPKIAQIAEDVKKRP